MKGHRVVEPQAALLDQDITAVVVATTLVSDARSKTVSSVMGSRAGHHRAVAVGLLEHHLVATADQHHGAGQSGRPRWRR